MNKLEYVTRYFPLWVITCSLLSIYNPNIFVWFSGDLITYGLAGIMLGMGLTLKINDFKRVIKSPSWLLIGLVLQFTVMPFFGWLLGILFDLPVYFAVGLILVSCCPGGTASNVIVYLARANVALSVVMTTFSTIFAIFLTPFLTAYLSGSYLDVDAWGLFFSTLKVVLFPVGIGLFLNFFSPKFTKLIKPFSPPVAVILITLAVVGRKGSQYENKIVSRTISIEVGMQNSGLGVVLARENFINPATAIPSAISSLVHSIYGSIFVSLFKK